MAQNCVPAADVQDIQFKLHNKVNVFNSDGDLRSYVNLLSGASSKGILFAGNPNLAELRVSILKDIVETKDSGKNLLMRSVPLPGIPNHIACSADGNFLALNYFQSSYSLLDIYSVDSFLTPNPLLQFTIRLSPEDGVFATHILWNPVLTNIVAVVLSNGAVGIYTLQSNGNFEMYSLDKGQQVKCACWSPKGKQIVFGLPNGKLQQYKPDLTPAKAIVCPTGVHPNPFDTIAVHWLSTYQFAVTFVERGEATNPSLYIVNAPKGGTPTYINYYDICYSGCGPRKHQMTFVYIHQWNILLAISANAVEVGIMGTNETGDTPTWVQYTLLDEARIEMPLNESNDETYPIGFFFDTASTHRLTIAEKELPVMPMVHLLSTNGQLICFNFLNLNPNAVGVCSPPAPVNDTSMQFKAIEQLNSKQTPSRLDSNPALQESKASADMTFVITSSAVTSTPAPKERTSLFGGPILGPPPASQPIQRLGTGISGQLSGLAPGFVPAAVNPMSNIQFATAATTTNATPPSFGSGNTSFSFQGFTGTSLFNPVPTKPNEVITVAPMAPIVQQSSNPQVVVPKPATTESVKALYTVQPTFQPPAPLPFSGNNEPKNDTELNKLEVDKLINEMLLVKIIGFDLELKKMTSQSDVLLSNIGNLTEYRKFSERLDQLIEITEQANEPDFEVDLQNLTQSLNEGCAMFSEARSKLQMYKEPDTPNLANMTNFDPVNMRHLNKLQSMLQQDQNKIQSLDKIIEGQWANYQDLVCRNTKSQMHVPCMDGIYQRISKLKDHLNQTRNKQNQILSEMKRKGLLHTQLNNNEVNQSLNLNSSGNNLDSLVDSILSISLSNVVDQKCSKLSNTKQSALRKLLNQKKDITIIKPRRPDRIGLKSEVILETNLENKRMQRENANANLAKMQQDKLPQMPIVPSDMAVPIPLAKPTATKPVAGLQSTITPFAPLGQTPAVSSSFAFGGASSFVKPLISQSNEFPKPSMQIPSSKSTLMFQTSTVPTVFVPTDFAKAADSIAFNQQKPLSSLVKTTVANSPLLPTPMSFAPKIIGGETNHPIAPTNTTGTSTIMRNMKPVNKDEPVVNKTMENLVKPFAASANSNVFAGTGSTMFSGFSLKQSDAKASGNAVVGGFGGSAATTTAGNAFTINKLGEGFSSGSNLFAGRQILTPFKFATTGENCSTVTTISNAGSKPVTSIAATTPTNLSPTPAFKQIADNSNTEPIPASSASTVPLSLTPTPTPITSSIPILTPTTIPTTTVAITPVSTSDVSRANDFNFNAFNICKPNIATSNIGTSATPAPATNIFSELALKGESSSADATKSLFVSSTSANSTAKGFSFLSAAANLPQTTTAVAFATSAVATTTSDSAPITSLMNAANLRSKSNLLVSSAPGSTPAANTQTNVVSVGVVSSSAAATSPATSMPPVFGTSPLFSSTTFATTVANTTAPVGTTATLSQLPIPSTSVTTTSSADATKAADAVSSIFGAKTSITSPEVSKPGSIFGNTAASSPPSGLFASVQKSEESIFNKAPSDAASSGRGIFAAAAAAAAASNPSPFGGAPNTGENLFMSNTSTGNTVFGGAATGGSIFGNAAAIKPPMGLFEQAAAQAAPANAASGGSIFGMTSPTRPVEGGSIFGNSNPTNPPIGGSIFGASSVGFGQATGGNIFSSPTSPQPLSPGGFGSGGNIFGGNSNANAQSSGSLFGGGGATSPVASAGGSLFDRQPSNSFNVFAQATSPQAGFGGQAGSGSFASGGASVSQSGFGSPPQQASAFPSPVFGGTAFGTQPSFGAMPSFGSNKGFGSFNSPGASPGPVAQPFGSPPAQKSNLFETLGASDSGLSFGNLAQTTNTNPQKPTFGGSSFMNYRS